MDERTIQIILASTSRYRAGLLHRLGIAFTQRAPDVDEAELPGETPDARALRLATAKAAAVAAGAGQALVIGSDQVASLHGRVLHKPGDAATARAQLAASSGQDVVFSTAVCLHDAERQDVQIAVDHTTVSFRRLTPAEIDRYVAREQPLDCAGSFKCEGLGIALFTRVDSTDPTALIGLPLIALSRLLRDAGLAIP